MKIMKYKGRSSLNNCWIVGHLIIERNGLVLIRDFAGTSYKVNPETVCMETGIKADDGTLVYENDLVIVESSYFTDEPPETEILLVEWRDSCAGFWFKDPITGVWDSPFEGCTGVQSNIIDSPIFMEDTESEVEDFSFSCGTCTREVMFRAKSIKDGEWVYGVVTYNGDDVYIQPVDDRIKWDDICYGVHVAPETLGQYTGISDVSHLDVFEGDIIDDGVVCSIVIYGNYDSNVLIHKDSGPSPTFSYIGFHTKPIELDYDCETEFLDPNGEFQVIGNIHDNSEMLEL